jgi:hypothetical protein
VHFPLRTSKWNKVGHRLFSRITRGLRGQPQTDPGRGGTSGRGQGPAGAQPRLRHPRSSPQTHPPRSNP